MVVEAGVHDINGKKFQAGKLPGISNVFSAVTFAESFSSVPSVFCQAASVNEAAAITVRLKTVTVSGFNIAVQEEEAADKIHTGEDIFFTAIQQGAGDMGRMYEAINIATNITHNWYTNNFMSVYSEPHLFASMQTYNGGDTCALRYNNLNSADVQLKVEEEISLDSEVSHAGETIAYMSINGAGDLQASASTVEPPETLLSIAATTEDTAITAAVKENTQKTSAGIGVRSPLIDLNKNRLVFTLSDGYTSYKNVRIRIFTVNGKLMQDITSNSREVTLEASDKNGRPFPSGVYMYQIEDLDSGKLIKRAALVMVK
ncbi:MAG TPA: hypothetical protein DC049_15650 [Spirochaetia bacterium]|nr:hypothetical protein [Spirochaetia bacterium]